MMLFVILKLSPLSNSREVSPQAPFKTVARTTANLAVVLLMEDIHPSAVKPVEMKDYMLE
jgi:hypothetical protein